MKALLLLALLGCASAPSPPRRDGVLPPMALVVENTNLNDAVIYALPCGGLECPIKLGDVYGAHTSVLAIEPWHRHSDGRMYLAFALRPARSRIAVPAVQVPSDFHVKLTIAPTLGQAFAFAEIDR